MSHKLAILRAKLLSYMAILFVAIFIYLAIATWDTTINWKFLFAGVFTFIIFIVAMLIWDEEETHEANEIKEREVAQMKMAKVSASQQPAQLSSNEGST